MAWCSNSIDRSRIDVSDLAPMIPQLFVKIKDAKVVHGQCSGLGLDRTGGRRREYASTGIISQYQWEGTVQIKCARFLANGV